MRCGAHRLTGVGGVPGETKSVPSPSRRITCCPAEVTATEPRATNTPKGPLLGPAKNCVPRTAISAKGLRIRTPAGALRCGRSNSNGPERSVISPPASTRNRSIFSLACSPSLIVVLRPSRIPQSRRDTGHDFVGEKDRRGPIERAANRVALGECLTLDVLDRADPLGCARRCADKDERECQRSVAEKPASIAGPVALDLAEVGHRRSPSA